MKDWLKLDSCDTKRLRFIFKMIYYNPCWREKNISLVGPWIEHCFFPKDLCNERTAYGNIFNQTNISAVAPNVITKYVLTFLGGKTTFLKYISPFLLGRSFRSLYFPLTAFTLSGMKCRYCGSYIYIYILDFTVQDGSNG